MRGADAGDEASARLITGFARCENRTMTEGQAYDDLVRRVRELIAQLDRPPVVAIGGHGGSGKSTLALRLAADLGLVPAQIVPTDRLYAAVDTRRADLFELQDWPAILHLLGRVRTGTESRLRYRARGYDGHEASTDEPMPAALIIEGIRILRPETMALIDLAVWLDLDPRRAGERAKARNREQGDSEAEVALWDTKWIPEGREYEALVRPQQLADIVLHPDDGR
jgi:uridine kinase